MRDIDADLLTAQLNATASPTFSLSIGAFNATTYLVGYTYQEVAQASAQITLRLDNSTGFFNSLPAAVAQGAVVTLTRGLLVSNEAKVEALPDFWVDGLFYQTGGDQSLLVVECIDWWGKLDRYRSEDNQAWSATDIRDIVEWILGEVGLTLAAGALTSLTLDFTIRKAETGGAALRRLMDRIPDYLYAGLDGEIKHKVLDTSEVACYTFGWNDEHPVLGISAGQRAMLYNKITVEGVGTAIGSASDAASIALVGERLLTIVDTILLTNADCEQRAEAELSFYQALATEAAVVCHAVHGLEMYDVVEMDAPPWGGDDVTGRVIRYSEVYGSGLYEQRISLGLAPVRTSSRGSSSSGGSGGGSTSYSWWQLRIENLIEQLFESTTELNETVINLTDLAVPAGGATGEVLSKASGDDYDMEWAAVSGVPAATQIGQVLYSTDGEVFTAELPVTDEAGWLVEETSGILIVA